MSSVTTKALLQLELSRCLERQKYTVLDDNLKSQSNGDGNDATADLTLHMQGIKLFEHIQHLDIQLHDYVGKKDYFTPQKIVMEMQQRAPELYYGYLRSAQVHLIINKYDKAFEAYHQGFKNILHRDGIELLRKSAEDSQHIFDQAAIELAKANQFDEANKVASGMISLFPKSPMVYLRAGELYVMQYRTKDAMEMYDQSTQCSSTDNQDGFAERMTHLRQRIGHMPHYDFIEQVPLEITAKVAQGLTTCDLIECLKVSKSWKDRIERCPEAWRVLNVERNGANYDINAIQNISRFVQQVTIRPHLMHPSLLKDLLTLMGDGEFEALKYLDLDCSQYMPQVIKIFDHSINLTRLDLIFTNDQRNGHIPLHQVLRSCPQLKRLTYHAYFDELKVDHELFPEEPTMITQLSIGAGSYYERMDTPHFFIPLIPLFPLLVDLCLSGKSPGDLSAITEQFPNIRQFTLAEDPCDTTLDFSIAEDTPKGLYLKVDSRLIDPENLASAIDRSSKTLISVDVNLSSDDDGEGLQMNRNWNWARICKLDCPFLRKLHFFTDYYWPFEQWIGDCPALEEITLEGVTELTDLIFDNFARLPNLRTLELEDCQKLTDAGLSGFFNQLQKQGSQLHTVKLRFCNLLGVQTLLSLASLQSLRNLGLYTCDSATEIVFQDFVARMNSNSSIEHLSLCLLHMTDQLLLHLLRALPRLRQLNIFCLGKITDSFVNAVVDPSSSINLAKLGIAYCEQITRGAIDNARKRIDIIEYDDIQ
ncbi:hypothetical protein BJV82DRAFT_709113 [Fennellomyces sp. T-0311]|nr:hypothetical protein BJV82DRAFT_709113 [Fennellomyces sp. T-0311]